MLAVVKFWVARAPLPLPLALALEVGVGEWLCDRVRLEPFPCLFGDVLPLPTALPDVV